MVAVDGRDSATLATQHATTTEGSDGPDPARLSHGPLNGSALCLDPQRFHYWLPASGGRRAVDRPGGASVNVVRRPVMLWCRMSVRRTPTCGVCRPSVADCSQLRAAVTHVIVIIWEQSCCIHHRWASICYREPATYHIMIACFFLCRQQ